MSISLAFLHPAPPKDAIYYPPSSLITVEPPLIHSTVTTTPNSNGFKRYAAFPLLPLHLPTDAKVQHVHKQIILAITRESCDIIVPASNMSPTLSAEFVCAYKNRILTLARGKYSIYKIKEDGFRKLQSVEIKAKAPNQMAGLVLHKMAISDTERILHLATNKWKPVKIEGIIEQILPTKRGFVYISTRTAYIIDTTGANLASINISSELLSTMILSDARTRKEDAIGSEADLLLVTSLDALHVWSLESCKEVQTIYLPGQSQLLHGLLITGEEAAFVEREYQDPVAINTEPETVESVAEEENHPHENSVLLLEAAVSMLDNNNRKTLTRSLITRQYDPEDLLARLKAPLDILIVRVRMGDLDALGDLSLQKPLLAIQACEEWILLEGIADRRKMWRRVILSLLSSAKKNDDHILLDTFERHYKNPDFPTIAYMIDELPTYWPISHLRKFLLHSLSSLSRERRFQCMERNLSKTVHFQTRIEWGQLSVRIPS